MVKLTPEQQALLVGTEPGVYKVLEVYQDDDINFCLADGTTLIAKKGKNAKKAHSYWNDAIAIIVGALALLVLLSLLTSASTDRSWFGTGNGGATRNWIGPVGANIAAVLFNFFGWASYLLPVLIGLVAWRVFQSDTLVPRPLRVLGFVFFVASLAGLMSLFFGAAAGAIVGEAAAQGTAHFIGSVGTGILLGAIFIASLLLVTNFTLASFLSHFDVAWGNLRIRMDEWREGRRADHAPEIAAAQKRAERRRLKRDEPETIPPTISVGEVQAMAAAAAVGRAAKLGEEPYDSIPTIDAENPYDTVQAVEPPEFEEVFAKDKAATRNGRKTKIEEPKFNEEATPEPIKGPKQDFDDYKLPTPDMLPARSSHPAGRR